MSDGRRRRWRWLRRLAAVPLIVAGTAADAGQEIRFDLPAQPLDESLQQVAERFDLKIAFYNEFTDGLQAPPLRGAFTSSEAFDALLDDTPLEYIFVVQTTVAVRPRTAVAATPQGGPTMNQDENETDPDVGRTTRAGAVRSFVAGLAATLLAGPGSAGSADDETDTGNEDDKVEIVIVTGTRMKLPPAQQINNVITYTAEDLETMGVATVDEVFRRLPQNIFGGTQAGGANSNTDYSGRGELELETFNGTANVTGASTVNLRGIGERGTLILVDGKRIGQSGMLGGFSDISSIPMAMVERVDILLDGASVIYGPDAIGGVVNIILRKDFKGVHVRVRHDAPMERGQTQQTASIATTYGWDGGSLTGSLNYFRTGALDLSDSNILSVSTYGGFTPFGTVRGQGWPPPVAIGALTEAYGEPAYEASVPESSDGVVAVEDFRGTVNNPLRDDNPRTGNDLIPARTDYNIRLDFRQELGAGVGLHAAVQHAPRETNTSQHNTYVEFSVPEDNPHNPFGESVLLAKRFSEFRDLITRGESDSLTLDAGFDGELPGRWFEGWDWQVEGRLSRIETETMILNELRRRQLDAAVAGKTLIGENGYNHGQWPYLDRDDGLFLNPFGETLSAVNPQTLVDELDFPPQLNTTLSETVTINAFVRGEVYELPAGSIQLVLGSERRSKVLDFQYRTTDTRMGLTNNGLGIQGFTQATNLDDQRAERTVNAFYAEFFVPIAKDLPLVRELTATLSARTESADGTGASPPAGGEPGVEKSGSYDYETWQLGASWQIVEGLRLHGSRHTSFITPSLLQLSINVPSAVPHSIVESFWPSFVDASVNPPVNYVAEGIPLPWILQGSNPELKPERGTVNSIGLEWRPGAVPGLEAELSYADTGMYDRIALRPELAFAGLTGTTVTPEILARFPNSLRRYDSGPYEGYIRELDGRAINIGYQENANLDYRLRYRVETTFGEFSIQANVNKVIAYNRLDSQNDDAGQLRKFVGPNAREVSACSENDLQGRLQTLTDLGFEVLTPIEHDAANSSFFCRLHVAEIVATGNRIPKYSQHLNVGWEYRSLRLNVDLTHREDASQLGGGRTGVEWVTQNYPVNVNLSGSYDFDAGGWFGAPAILRGTTLRFGINDLLDHRTKITFNGETDDEFNQSVSFLDYSNRSYYVEIAATLTGMIR